MGVGNSLSLIFSFQSADLPTQMKPAEESAQ